MQKVTIAFVRASRISLMFVFCGFANAQQVAYLDTGVDSSAGLNIGQGYNYFNNTDSTADVSDREPEGHGTVSARAISESFSGKIIPFVIADPEYMDDEQMTVARDNALSDILGKESIKVVAISVGFDGVTASSAPLMPQLSNAGKFISIMADNDSSSQPSALASSSFNLSGVIIVGAANAKGEMLSNSNRAGTTANKFVTAIGTPGAADVDVAGGSSWASARVAGIAGAVFLQNPNLTAAEVVDVILQSAEDKGELGTDAVYGRGFIANAQQVLNNAIGPVAIPTDSGGGGGSSGGGAALLVGGALVGALVLMRKPSDKLQKTLVLDSYGRGFHVDLNNHISVDEGILNISTFFNALEQKSIDQIISFPMLNTDIAFSGVSQHDHRIDLIEQFAMQGDVILNDDSAAMSMAITTSFDSGMFVSGGYRINPVSSYSATNGLDYHDSFGQSSFISSQVFGSLLSGFSTQANSFDVGYRGNGLGKTALKMGLVTVDQPQRFGLDSMSAIIEGKYEFADNAGVSLQFGQLEEQGSLFGGAAGGLFGVDTAVTYAVNMSGNLKVNDQLSIVANYGVGQTDVNATKNSVLNGFDKIKSNWYSLGLVGNNLFRAKDQLGFAYSQPLKVTDGHVDYSIPKHYNLDGSIHFDSERVNLADTGATEQTLEAYYRTKLNNKLELGSYFTYRHNPNHVSQHGDDAMFMATIRYVQ